MSARGGELLLRHTTGLDVPAEFHGPVDYAGKWLWLALLAILLVVAYYVAVLWLTRKPPPPPPPAPTPLPDVRTRHLQRLDRIEAELRAGELSPRDAHQQLSEVVRSYVEAITPLPATTMTLADFRVHAPRPLADMIEVMYPPEFAPGESDAMKRFEHAMHQARGLVSTWRR